MMRYSLFGTLTLIEALPEHTLVVGMLGAMFKIQDPNNLVTI